MRRSFFTAALISGCILRSALARADVRLPAIISDNMVLQASRTVPIWGSADPGERVLVTLGRQSRSATADSDGRWMVKLKDLPAGGPETITVTGHNTITIHNILIGSVWVCSGQSNMEFSMAGAHNAATEIPKANYPRIRLFTVARKTALDPQSDVTGRWVECTPETVQSFSAVGYFFGQDIHEVMGEPVGLIHSSWGGTPAQAWTSLTGLQKERELQEYVDSFQKVAEAFPRARVTYPQELAEYEVQLQQWNEEVGNPYKEALKAWTEEARQAREAGRPEPPRPQPARPEPRRPAPPDGGPGTPAVLYNGMIAPLIPYAIKGVIWYQGESNASKPVQYQTLFPRMIRDWREKWGQGDFPFLYVQLANFMARKEEPSESNWAALREAQLKTLSLPRTGMAVIIDIGEASDIHPKDKMDVGHRLALAAQKIALKRKIVSSGPLYAGMRPQGDRIRLRFKETGSGLTIGAAPPIRLDRVPEPPGPELKGFAIAGEDRKWEWASAQIDGDSVVVWSDRVSHPVAVRYAWADNPECNLYNREGLPASPFRTDDWPLGQ